MDTDVRPVFVNLWSFGESKEEKIWEHWVLGERVSFLFFPLDLVLDDMSIVSRFMKI